MKRTILTTYLLCWSSILLAQPTEGLLAFYPLGDDSASDLSGNGYHGDYFGPAAGSGHNNDPSAASYFNGTTDYIAFPDFDPWVDFSISGWFRFTGSIM